MNMTEIRDYSRRLFGLHGDKAELEAAQRAVACERQGERDQARNWRRIRAQGDARAASELIARFSGSRPSCLPR